MGRLTEMIKKIKSVIECAPDLPKDAFIVAIVVLVGALSFILGRLSATEHMRQSELRVSVSNDMINGQTSFAAVQEASLDNEEDTPAVGGTVQSFSSSIKGMYVASKRGTTYHLPWCPGAGQIKEENKIWFSSKEEAEIAGLRPASNCKGI